MSVCSASGANPHGLGPRTLSGFTRAMRLRRSLASPVSSRASVSARACSCSCFCAAAVATSCAGRRGRTTGCGAREAPCGCARGRRRKVRGPRGVPALGTRPRVGELGPFQRPCCACVPAGGERCEAPAWSATAAARHTHDESQRALVTAPGAGSLHKQPHLLRRHTVGSAALTSLCHVLRDRWVDLCDARWGEGVVHRCGRGR